MSESLTNTVHHKTLKTQKTEYLKKLEVSEKLSTIPKRKKYIVTKSKDDLKD